jgi:hypothetical protein
MINPVDGRSHEGKLNAVFFFRVETMSLMLQMNDLIGDLSLLAKGGNQALPLGHIVAYKAGHSLHLKFAKALRAACDSPDDWEPALPWDLSIIMEAESQQQERQQEREG